MSATAEVIIHILGLAMFLPQPQIDAPPESGRAKKAAVQRMIASPPRITVVFPKVEHHHGGVTQQVNINSNDTPVHDWAAGIETHTAIIAFHGQYSVEGWVVEDLYQTSEGLKWKYIRLSGEQLTLQPGISTPLTSTTLALPRLKLNPQPTALADGYLPPYPSAAAVLEIRDGVVTPCYQKIDSKNVAGRVDTEIFLPTNGQLTISGGPGKSLTLTAANMDKTVYLANVPLRYALNANSTDTYQTGHYKAYCAMMSGTSQTCDFDFTTEERPSPTCGGGEMKTSGAQPIPYGSGSLPIGDLTSFECSNTQWP